MGKALAKLTKAEDANARLDIAMKSIGKYIILGNSDHSTRIIIHQSADIYSWWKPLNIKLNSSKYEPFYKDAGEWQTLDEAIEHIFFLIDDYKESDNVFLYSSGRFIKLDIKSSINIANNNILAKDINSVKAEQITDAIERIQDFMKEQEKKVEIEIIADCVLEILHKKKDLNYILSDEDIDYIFEAVKMEFGQKDI